jgi:hypothetical protein
MRWVAEAIESFLKRLFGPLYECGVDFARLCEAIWRRRGNGKAGIAFGRTTR